MHPVVLGAPNRNQNDIVLLAILNETGPNSGLNVGIGLAQLWSGGHPILFQDSVDLGFWRIPDPFFFSLPTSLSWKTIPGCSVGIHSDIFAPPIMMTQELCGSSRRHPPAPAAR